jgi:hypothetical protein
VTALLELPAEYGRVVAAGETHRPTWLVDSLVAGDGLTAITGGSKSGKTTLAIRAVQAMRDPKGHDGHLCGSWIERRIGRALVIATFGQHQQWANAFAADADVVIIEAPGTPAPGFWKAYAEAAGAFEADLVVIDTVQSLAGVSSQENLAGLFGFPCPVLGVFTGYTTTPGISDGPEYQSLAISSLWLHREKKTDALVATVMTRWTADRNVPVGTHSPAAVLAPPAGGLTGEQVRRLGELVRTSGIDKRGGPGAIAGKLLAECWQDVVRIVGREIKTVALLTGAIGEHFAEWEAGLGSSPALIAVQEEEPPF